MLHHPHISSAVKGTFMYKKTLVGLALLAILTTIFAACAIRDESGPSGPTVHIMGSNCVQPSITISKGDSITLIVDDAVAHTIKNGTWNGGNQVLKTESGALSVSVNLNGNDSATLGLFTTGGTFHLLCTIHPGMNLAVIVS